jgi:elongation factor 1-beta
MSAYATVAALEKHLSTRSYVEGFALSAKDSVELKAHFGSIDAKLPNATRWAKHVIALTGFNVFGAAGAAAPAAAKSSAPAAAAPAAKAAAADDDFDMVRILSV